MTGNATNGLAMTLWAIFVLFMMDRGYGETKNPLETIRAENFDAKSRSIKLEACSLGGRDICSVHDGDYIIYRHYDFDSGVAAFKASIATKSSGEIEIRLDSRSGPLAGICHFDDTGGWQDWQDVGCDVDGSLPGVRDIYLIFHGNSKNALINLNSFVFQKSIEVSPTPGLSSTIKRVDIQDGEPQAPVSWGEPQSVFADSF
jgi:hypothetical protein